MINYLQGCYNNTPIGMLPTIINHNNEAIEDEFNWIFDSSLNRLTKSVYVPTGSITAHNGEFINLLTEYITIKNINSLVENVIPEILDYINDNINDLIGDKVVNYFQNKDNIISHHILADCFNYSDIIGNYTHDATTIYVPFYGKNLYTVLTEISNKNEIINTSISDINTSISAIDEKIQNIYSQLDIDIDVDAINTSISNMQADIDDIYNSINLIDIINTSIDIQNETITNISSTINNLNSKLTDIKDALNNIDISINDVYNTVNNNHIDFDNRILSLESAQNIVFVNQEEDDDHISYGINMYVYNILQTNENMTSSIDIFLNDTNKTYNYSNITNYSKLKKYYIKILNFDSSINFYTKQGNPLRAIIANMDDNIITCSTDYCYEFEITENITSQEGELESVLVNIKKYKNIAE